MFYDDSSSANRNFVPLKAPSVVGHLRTHEKRVALVLQTRIQAINVEKRLVFVFIIRQTDTLGHLLQHCTHILPLTPTAHLPGQPRQAYERLALCSNGVCKQKGLLYWDL
ncbi:hypothetical protein E2C01_008499 [Portunus trituberculatus]|uniref:Uncharacterized protein n=1 Tax=Portunus trituberculatus TaxID=210409 RepID=A0A5B7D217_PORTR|nr:hypothetical protein [Portunus trituberculatus]